MVKRRDLLADVDAEAGLRYEETRLARRAPAARRRLAFVLLLGAGALALEAALARQALWLVPALVAGLASWGVRRGRLGALMVAGLLALLAALVPLALLGIGPRDPVRVVTFLVSVALGAAALPDVLLLVRDAELQHAYGLWARRSR